MNNFLLNMPNKSSYSVTKNEKMKIYLIQEFQITFRPTILYIECHVEKKDKHKCVNKLKNFFLPQIRLSFQTCCNFCEIFYDGVLFLNLKQIVIEKLYGKFCSSDILHALFLGLVKSAFEIFYSKCHILVRLFRNIL